MAEVVGVVAGIGSVLKVLTSAGLYLKGMGNASHEAQAVARQVTATEAILKALQASVDGIHRPRAFFDAWDEPARLALHDIQVTIQELNDRLGRQDGKAELGAWDKVTWPFAREENLILQQHMQSYMQMLGMVQNAFLQGNLKSVQESANAIDDIYSDVGTLPSSGVGLSKPHYTRPSVEILPDDSVSRIGLEVNTRYSTKGTKLNEVGELTADLENQGISTIKYRLREDFRRVVGYISFVDCSHLRDSSIFSRDSSFRWHPQFRAARYGRNSPLVHALGTPELKHKNVLGPGQLTLTLASDRSCVWIVYHFDDYAEGQLTWRTTNETSIHRWWAVGDIPIMCIRHVLSSERRETAKTRSWIVEQLCITPKGSMGELDEALRGLLRIVAANAGLLHRDEYDTIPAETGETSST